VFIARSNYSCYYSVLTAVAATAVTIARNRSPVLSLTCLSCTAAAAALIFIVGTVNVQVNLLPGERPRDVYAGVCAEVNKKLAAIATTELGTDATPEEIKAHKYCTMLTGSVDRKVRNC
jgi:DNA-directed RNA polymerase